MSIVEPTASSADAQATPPSTDGAQKLERTAKRDARFSRQESTALASQSTCGRALDRDLAGELGRGRANTRAVSSSYIHRLGRGGRLPAVAERELVLHAAAGDSHARARLVEEFLPLIGSVARNYRSSPQITRTELLQEGVVGLLRALERYDPTLQVPFWAYASWWVRQAMQQLVAELTRPVAMSDRALRQLAQIKDAHAELHRDGRSPTLKELSDHTGLDHGQLVNLIAADRPPRALEQPIETDEGVVGAFGELIADPLAEDEYERVVTQVTASELRDLLSTLSDRERAILRARYGLDGDPESLRAIAGRLGVSSERVRQLENRALGKLRAACVP
jgi:RNA polymerase sigma factor (sigma-70 family)